MSMWEVSVMRFLFIALLFTSLISSTLFCEELEKQPSQIEILISKIKSAKSPDKRILMNQLKVQLREMNRETRREVMRELKNSFIKSAETCNTGFKQGRNGHNSKGLGKGKQYLKKKGKR